MDEIALQRTYPMEVGGIVVEGYIIQVKDPITSFIQVYQVELQWRSRSSLGNISLGLYYVC